MEGEQTEPRLTLRYRARSHGTARLSFEKFWLILAKQSQAYLTASHKPVEGRRFKKLSQGLGHKAWPETTSSWLSEDGRDLRFGFG